MPIILLMVDVVVQILLNCLVRSLRLTIDLRVIRGCESMVSAHEIGK